MEQIELIEGMVIFRPLFKDFLLIRKIETHAIVDKKKAKLKDPIIHIEYLLNFKPSFTSYSKDVYKMLSFGSWIKQANEI